MDTNEKIHPFGRLITQYLQENVEGVTLTDVVQHLQDEHGEESTEDLKRSVQLVLDNGAALGFLERKGSHFITCLARGARCCRRRRRRKCGCPRRRRRCCRRRRSRCRRRRRRC
ncbi:unnamed protein product [Pieris macdunnoughi]|uniref:Uncharacterized protein n=1 Tax=Pieris macdunnoughi TaxID=345717 RepID=A0A821L925_9NEOP|nr:unnamed protein product [Pieris macdunnoughi]